MPMIKVNNINLFYQEVGAGDPIVLINGIVADHTAWNNIIGELAKSHRVITLDNRGVGLTDCPNYPYTVEMMAEDVVGLCRALKLDTVNFVGNSLGGCIVQYLALKYPELTKSATISNSFAKINPRARLWVQARTAMFKSNLPLEVVEQNNWPQIFSNEFLARPGIEAQLLEFARSNPKPITEIGFLNQISAGLNFDSSSWVKDIARPCLVVGADEDLYADVEEARNIAQVISGAKFYCFKNVGHLPHIEQPEEFSKVVLDFISAGK